MTRCRAQALVRRSRKEKHKMKTKLAALILLATFGLAVTSFADEQQASRNQTQILYIKRLDGSFVELTQDIHAQSVKIRAHGETVAEFKVSTNNPVVVEGGVMDYANKPRLIGVNGGVLTIRINCSGEFPFIFKADEVEFDQFDPGVRERRKSFLLAE